MVQGCFEGRGGRGCRSCSSGLGKAFRTVGFSGGFWGGFGYGIGGPGFGVFGAWDLGRAWSLQLKGRTAALASATMGTTMPMRIIIRRAMTMQRDYGISSADTVDQAESTSVPETRMLT